MKSGMQKTECRELTKDASEISDNELEKVTGGIDPCAKVKAATIACRKAGTEKD